MDVTATSLASIARATLAVDQERPAELPGQKPRGQELPAAFTISLSPEARAAFGNSAPLEPPRRAGEIEDEPEGAEKVEDLRLPGQKPAEEPGQPVKTAEDAPPATDTEKPPPEAEGEQQDASTSGQLSEEQQQMVRELQKRDREVRSHEAAHQAAGGGLAGGASFSFQTGPDGRQYAIGGEVPIDVSGGRTPEETIAKAQRIRSAALAPADPSPQDRAVAAMASQMEAQARREKQELDRLMLEAKDDPSKARQVASRGRVVSPAMQSRRLDRFGLATDPEQVHEQG